MCHAKKFATVKMESFKINFVREAINKHDFVEESSQESLRKVFKPITERLNDVSLSNLKILKNLKKGRPVNKTDVPDYGIAIEDEVPDYIQITW